jgi:hypothetical protein
MLYSVDDIPHSVVSVVLWPGFFFVIACVVGYAAFRVEWAGKKAPWKWAALAPLAIGLIIGISALILVTDPAYELAAPIAGAGRKVTYALWGTFVLPILGFIGFGAWQLWARTQNIRY